MHGLVLCLGPSWKDHGWAESQRNPAIPPHPTPPATPPAAGAAAAAEPPRTLYAAAEQGDLSAASRFLAAWADPNELVGERGETAAHAAARGGHRGVLQLLLSHGAQVC